MSSRNKGIAKPCNSSAKQKAICETSTTPTVDDINVGVEDMGLNSDKKDGWVGCARKSKNKGGSSNAGKNQTVGPLGQGFRNTRKPVSRECYKPTPAAVTPALKNGWDWSSVACSNEDQDTYYHVTDGVKASCEHNGEDNESDLPDDDSDDELPSDDDVDDHSDVNEMSHEARKESCFVQEPFQMS
ncbi:protein SUPPRESSOR OF GENE SILENCING 3-like [Nicotiana tomentosiformis]|uniref:protein SUPPRESSOR OF GENE SILENCING 3-like n=1 Tax=Nicotiana tomentosiformis TaxID=4098 RepID=UPI00051C0282|nr:protein SUPPRESSOR OF GENE SILENCING 3-like [Nicotiana tomentosiformis]XP_009610692.1 protein SUPPRESSOR OF GENE SILENCING 3-like [Nicotiana tomentosiformis]XP_009610694.1 protein SUPPRESSOR OF GENE SILENCING 3-like [Nicotiana tomentosiformis]